MKSHAFQGIWNTPLQPWGHFTSLQILLKTFGYWLYTSSWNEIQDNNWYMSSSALHFIITIKIEEWYRDQEINVRGRVEIRDTKFEVEARFETSLRGNFEAEEFFEAKKSKFRGQGETEARNFTSFLGLFEDETRTSQTSELSFQPSFW